VVGIPAFGGGKMMIILGFLLLVIAAIVALVGILTNLGTPSELTTGFNIFGIPFSGRTGELFLFGVVVGAVGMLGLGMLLRGLGRRRAERREAKELKKRHTKLSEELERERAARAEGAGTGTERTQTGEYAESESTARPPKQRSAEQPTSFKDRLGLGRRRQ